MTEFMEPEEGNATYKPNGHKPVLNVARSTDSKSQRVQRDQPPVARQADQAVPPEKNSEDEDNLNLIHEVLDDQTGPHPLQGRPNRLAEKAADLVARYASEASTDSVFREYAVRLMNDLRSGQPSAEDGSSHGLIASAAYMEDSGLVRAMFKAASNAANEAEAGLQAALGVPMIIQQYKRVYRGLWPAIPALSTGTDVLARFLYRTPATRPLIVEIPRVLHATVERLSKHVSHRGAITSEIAGTVFAEQIETWLASRGRAGHPNGNMAGNQEEW